MADPRTLPIPAPHREFAIKVAGTEVSRAHHLLAVSVTAMADRIGSARLVYQDGAASAGDFPLSNAATFLPGQTVEILAGPPDSPVSLFKGIVVQQSLKVRDHTAPQLIVECRHPAVKLAVGRKNAYFFNQKDSDIISSLLSQAGVTGDVEATTVTHPAQVQYYCTDWDFLVLRAGANGKLVFTTDDTVTVKAPVFSGATVCTLAFGATVLELDVQMDARSQYSAVASQTWDSAQQKVSKQNAATPATNGPGNVDPANLAGVVALAEFTLQHSAVAADEAQAWADAEWLRSRMGKINGRAKCEGIATVHPGDLVQISGVGDRFSGSVFVTGVRHDFDLVQGWKTNLQFGGIEPRLEPAGGVTDAKASALLPGVNGLQTGVVVSNEDAGGEFRVQVRMPLVSADQDGTWARVAAPDAGDQRGFFFRPEVGDEVVLGFLNDDPRQAVILGMLHSSAKAAPLTGSNANNEKVYQSRSKLKLSFNDDTKVMQWATPGGNQVTLSDADQGITLQDQNGNQITLSADGITIQSTKALNLKAGTELKLESGTSLSVKAGTDLALQGTAGAELSSTAMTKVKGSLVQIN